MSGLVIVTDQCYLLCESINFIAVSEVEKKSDNFDFLSGRSKRKSKRQKRGVDSGRANDNSEEALYEITIDFIPVNAQNVPSAHRRADDTSSVTIQVRGKSNCHDLYTAMVSQIREQMPDQIYLDKLVESFLTS